MEDVVLRRMVAEDVSAVARLEVEIFSDPWPETAFAREVEETATAWPRVMVDAASGELVAYLVGWFIADEAHLANIAVATGARRRGLAQRLLDDMVTEGRRRGVRMLLLEVRRSNRIAQVFYAKNGFYPVKVRRRYYRDNGEDAFVLVKPLTEAGRLPALEGLA